MSRRNLIRKGPASAQWARAVLLLGLLIAVWALTFGVVPWSTMLASAPTQPEQTLGTWWSRALTVTLACYLFTSLSAVTIGALLGGLTAKRGARMLRPKWYNGAIRRGLELTGALPSVILCAIWLSSHPGQALPALMVVTLVQQAFEIGSRVRTLIESPTSTWGDFWFELSKSASQVAIALASGEIALVALTLTSPTYATWPSSVASYLHDGGQGAPPALLLLALCGTIALPACIFWAGPARSAPR